MSYFFIFQTSQTNKINQTSKKKKIIVLQTALTLALVCTFLTSVQAACILERSVTSSPSEYDAYSCVRSQDFHKDLDRLPLNTTKLVNVSFRDSKVPMIEKDSFKKLGTKTLGISIVHSGLREIDEEAFKGLTEVKALILRRNHLTEVKKTWFASFGKLGKIFFLFRVENNVSIAN